MELRKRQGVRTREIKREKEPEATAILGERERHTVS
jgi:hypothetical protein